MLAVVRQKMAIAKPQPDPGKASSNLISKKIRWQQLRDLELCRAIKPFPNYRLGGNAPYSKHQACFTETNILQSLYRTDIACRHQNENHENLISRTKRADYQVQPIPLLYQGHQIKKRPGIARFLPAMLLAERLKFRLYWLSRIAFDFCKAKICFLLPRFLLLLLCLAFLALLSPNFRNLFSFVAARQLLLRQFTLFAPTPARSNVIALDQTFATEMLFDLHPVVNGLATTCQWCG